MKFKFNIPNKITIIRISLIPLFALILLIDMPHKTFFGIQSKNLLAAFIFIMLSVSDFLDGYFARKKKQVTEFGKLIDPIADKFLISTALIFLIGKGVDLWIAVVIIAREVIITALRIYLIPLKLVVPASNFGKAKTVVQSIAIVFVLLNLSYSWYVMILAVLLTLVSGLEYLVRIRSMTGNRIVNLPNLLTLSRFLLIIPFIYYFLNSKMPIALALFATITLSDKLDGISARLMNQKTEIGSALDSFTDWILIITAFALFVVKARLKLFWLVLFLIPPIVSGTMKLMYAKKQKVVPVTFIARLSVGLTYITILGVMIHFRYILYLLVATAAITYAAMFVYIKINLKAFS